MQRTAATAILIVGAVALSACGDDEEEKQARTVVQTVTAAAEPPAPTTTVPETTPNVQTTPAEPLPEGVVGADGTYLVRVKKSDYEGENLIVDETSPTESEWRFTTTCKGSKCSIEMKRELGSGGFKAITMRPAQGRPGVFEGKATSTEECLIDPEKEKVATRQRYSIRLYDAADRNGRQTAGRIDVYMTEDPVGCEKDTKGTISWGGSLKG